MKSSGKRQVFTGILFSFLLLTMTWHGFVLPVSAAYRSQAFSFDSPKGSPWNNAEDQTIPLYLRQAIQSDILFPQINTVTNSYRASFKGAALAHSVMYLCHHGIGAKNAGASLHFFGTSNIILGLTTKCWVCQHLDLPPPGALVSL